MVLTAGLTVIFGVIYRTARTPPCRPLAPILTGTLHLTGMWGGAGKVHEEDCSDICHYFGTLGGRWIIFLLSTTLKNVAL